MKIPQMRLLDLMPNHHQHRLLTIATELAKIMSTANLYAGHMSAMKHPCLRKYTKLWALRMPFGLMRSKLSKTKFVQPNMAVRGALQAPTVSSTYHLT
ncbi:hypothetical protein N7448_011329 [Penicillium atrosanguineum]|nr:hypothetical protein N7448_011329 [Penicillium atrosanguineum]